MVRDTWAAIRCGAQEDGPDAEPALEEAPGPFHLGELLVAEGEVGRGQGVVVGVDDELPVPAFRLLHLGGVEGQASVAVLGRYWPYRSLARRAQARLVYSYVRASHPYVI